METRSIDTAQNASINLMTLNKKVVNMRSAVKRSKVHVINKLTRNITDLKQKKGSEEEKEKNLKKAQRYLDEIQSIRSLNEDKITKYSIANVSSFEEVSKTTISPGARALARLADHQFIKDCVRKFREEHNDWRDLAAFMLMQQTGRKFKSQKKDKKNISRAENINASKLMTKAYTQGLFREDGFKMAEEKSVKKRKKKDENTEMDGCVEKSIVSKQEKDIDKTDGEAAIKKIQKRMLDISEDRPTTNLDTGKESNQREMKGHVKSKVEDKECRMKEQKDLVPVKTLKIENSEKSLNLPSKINEKIQEDEEEMEKESDDNGSSGDECNEGESCSDEENMSTSSEVAESPEVSKNLDETPRKINIIARECVIKELNIGSDSDKNDSEDEISSNDSNDDVSSDSADSEEETTDTEENIKSKPSNKKKKKVKTVPNFLTEGDNRPHRLPRDPFFEGSDCDEGDDFEDSYIGENDFDYEDDGIDINNKFKGNKQTTKSLFYQPGEEKRSYEKKDFSGFRNDSFGSRGRGRGRFPDRSRGGFDKRGGRSSFGETRGRGSYKFRESNTFEKTKYKKFDDSKRFGVNKSANQGISGRFKSSASNEKASSVVSKPAEKLHPSWEASRKRKAEQSGGIKAFAGTKITFDDD